MYHRDLDRPWHIFCLQQKSLEAFPIPIACLDNDLQVN